MPRLPPYVPPVPSSTAAESSRPGAVSRPSGLTREALGRHGGVGAAGDFAARQGRPMTLGVERGPARGGAFRPLSLGTRPQPPLLRRGQTHAEPPGAGGAPGAATAPKSLVQARAAWLEAAKTYPLARGILQPLTITGRLLDGEDNVMCGNLRVLEHPELHEKWMVTEYDPRTQSTAKCRRWGLSDQGTFACVLEWLPFHERSLSEEDRQQERQRKLLPGERRDRATEAAELEAEVIREVQTATLLNRDLEVHAFFRTADGRLVAIMTDFPEEASYLSTKLAGPQRSAMAYRFFAEAATRLHQDLHRKGLVHGDFKPANVMMTAAGSYTLIDFEATRPLAHDGLVPAAECLEPTFAPPEFTATGRMGKAGDLWALGRSMVHLAAYGELADRSASIQDERALERTQQKFLRVERDFARALQTGSFEGLRAQVAASENPRGTFDELRQRHDYLGYLAPLAESLPEIFELTMRSLLARDPVVRRDALEARSLGQQMLGRHAAAIARSREVEQRVLRSSASLEMVEPTLRQIAEEERFVAG